ncbi:hypothetical protein ACLX1H_005623 [Fusarium chlamydosporum]
MAKENRVSKKDLNRLRKDQKLAGVDKPDTHNEHIDGRRSHKKKKRHDQDLKPLDSIRTSLFNIHNDIISRNKNMPTEIQEFCSRMGLLYSTMLELAFEMGTSEEDTAMEWQHEPTNHVRLVRTLEEEASYPNGAVISPWQTETNPAFRNVLNDGLPWRETRSIDGIL